MSKRSRRKMEHIKYSLLLEKKLKRNVFSDITLLHNCLSEVNLDEIDISTNLQNLRLEKPIIINAITGGFSFALAINRELAKIAREFGLAMAVGSQRIAIKDKSAQASFKVVREENPEGLIFANIGADASLEEVAEVVEMINADAVQIHLNTPQEIVMAEGRKCFAGTVDNIKRIAAGVKVPVIVKEVGFGIAREEARMLVDCGVKIIDVGGAGGTDFIAIENRRNRKNAVTTLEGWGIPTPVSLIEVISEIGDRADIIASGGLKTGLDVAKSLALGAKAAGLAGTVLYKLLKGGPVALRKYLRQVERELRYSMAMVGANNLSELRKRPLIITGKTYKWLKFRGIQIKPR
ncbi:type 2 isopentenyl-diphosphate Delta-isomerase [Thermosediminibacter oceani]|uniref:Isopentenyl-diphosphate delta-isomerase n=1 Tax=Thermosediminibacter oceani (strain ATCC BAA-1034 / DSM 16646 / JW/IW-1228P) TaxID=555079 RepID=D9S3E1_THEOJ|nr:type 2 isopentenyl-diphosphate Delta-isomerase [Thermosediminibacter oceani]ADL07918.1 isopentenyl-diphosphate delta-isomerase, type 2 [Thermosediminibacter oceani DSM 16646]